MCRGVCVGAGEGGGRGGSRDLWGWAPGTCNLSLFIRSKFFLPRIYFVVF